MSDLEKWIQLVLGFPKKKASSSTYLIDKREYILNDLDSKLVISSITLFY